jgi:hypothetical protein
MNNIFLELKREEITYGSKGLVIDISRVQNSDNIVIQVIKVLLYIIY